MTVINWKTVDWVLEYAQKIDISFANLVERLRSIRHTAKIIYEFVMHK
jgi:hypothetical protein